MWRAAPRSGTLRILLGSRSEQACKGTCSIRTVGGGASWRVSINKPAAERFAQAISSIACAPRRGIIVPGSPGWSIRACARVSGDGHVSKDDWGAVIGVDCETRIGLRAESDKDGALQFVLSPAEPRNHWNPQQGHDRRETGDGTVRRAGCDSALPQGIASCVRHAVRPRPPGDAGAHLDRAGAVVLPSLELNPALAASCGARDRGVPSSVAMTTVAAEEETLRHDRPKE